MYIPILKNRTVEISVIKELLEVGLSDRTIPLFEIIQSQTRSNCKKSFIDELAEIFDKTPHPFLLDIPKLNVTSSTNQAIKTFMTQVNRQKGFALEKLMSCHNIKGVIPVLSYNPREILSPAQMLEDLHTLRTAYSCIAFRITPAQFNKVDSWERFPFKQGDYFLLDIDDKVHTNPAFKNIYKDIKALKRNTGIMSILINSNRPQNLYNKNIIDGEPIEEIDNSLLEMYALSSYKFDGFGDYACISNTLPTTGGAISPAGIYYSVEGNFFVGYKGRTQSLSEFNDYIAPSIVCSSYWNEYNETHHRMCPGCRKIQAIVNGASGKSQGMWKGITMAHYIFTVDQLQNQ